MHIDNSITAKRIRKALSKKSIAIALLIVVIAATLFYITLENNDKKEIQIWFVTTESGDLFPSDALRQINDYGAQKGIDKIILTKRNPSDLYFDATLSTSAYYNCDIFIMNEEMVKKYAEMDMFLPIYTDGYSSDELIYLENNAVGVLTNENYYLLINKNTDVDLQMIYDILDLLRNK